MVSGKYIINVEAKDRTATKVSWQQKKGQEDKTGQNYGVYFIRTNYEKPQEAQLWKICNTIREVESTFRCLKSDLQIRPIYPQKDQRIESHIYLTILAVSEYHTPYAQRKGNTPRLEKYCQDHEYPDDSIFDIVHRNQENKSDKAFKTHNRSSGYLSGY